MSGPDRKKKSPANTAKPYHSDRPNASASSNKPEFDDLARLFRQCGLNLPDARLKKFWEFHQLLRRRNEELDLTRLHSFETMVVKHYVDCALIPTLVDLEGPLLDIGTGAGFPGIPLKIMRPDLPMILAEGRGRRLEFLEEAIELLGLSEVELYPHKVSSRFDLPVRAVITRDLEAMHLTLERASHFLPKGGLLYFLKGPSVDREIDEAAEFFNNDFRIINDIAYDIGRTGLKRRLVVAERVGVGQIRPVFSQDGPGFREIASRKNPQVKTWTKLLDGRGIKKHGLAIVSGLKQVTETLRDYPEICRTLIGQGPKDPDVDAPEHVERYRLRPELFKELDQFGAGAPLLVIEAPPLADWDPADWPQGCTLMIPFQDPTNVGAVLRTASALGAVRAVLLEEAASPWHPKSLRAAGPALFRIPMFKGPSINDLDPDRLPLVALAMDGRNIGEFSFPESFGLIPGVEGPGLPERLKKAAAVAIPMEQGVESLNAATAAAIVLYEVGRRKRGG